MVREQEGGRGRGEEEVYSQCNNAILEERVRFPAGSRIGASQEKHTNVASTSIAYREKQQHQQQQQQQQQKNEKNKKQK